MLIVGGYGTAVSKEDALKRFEEVLGKVGNG